MKKAFLVIVDYTDAADAPEMGDISSAISHAPWLYNLDWKIHTTEATAEMLAHHGVPYPPENVETPRCTCPDYPGVDWHDYGCPLRPTPENVETSNE